MSKADVLKQFWAVLEKIGYRARPLPLRLFTTGEGECLHNMNAVEALQDIDGQSFPAPFEILVSTHGRYLRPIAQFARRKFRKQPVLQASLDAMEEPLRREIADGIPPIPDFMAALNDYRAATGGEVYLNYTLFRSPDGKTRNDTASDAVQLADLARANDLCVKISRYNDINIKPPRYVAVSPTQESIFKKFLEVNRVRLILQEEVPPDSIPAGCGQLHAELNMHAL